MTNKPPPVKAALEALFLSANGSLLTAGDVKYTRDACKEAHAELKEWMENAPDLGGALEASNCDDFYSLYVAVRKAAKHLQEGIG